MNPTQFPMKSSTVRSTSRRKKRGTRSHKNLMKARLIYPNVKNATWIVQKTPYSKNWWKMGVKGLLSHRDPSFLPWSRKKESREAIIGVKGQEAHIYVYIGPRAQFEDFK